MKIGFGSDHGGYNLKCEIIEHLAKKGIDCIDFGADDAVQSVDYPIYGQRVAEAVAAKDVDCGIVCCGTGIGISLAANKVPGIRCAVVSDTFSAKMSKAHNNANMLSLGERVLGRGLALEIVDAWLETEFEGGRHQKRVDLISAVEEKYNK
ncbi:MAG: ribose 5-phosphate isomerase B [Clostridioides sp.]|jgi:ribose 5-phosphate isomerase B|nr:ribose 5-phosphate isomerase B [Clostridioides sp.]